MLWVKILPMISKRAYSWSTSKYTIHKSRSWPSGIPTTSLSVAISKASQKMWSHNFLAFPIIMLQNISRHAFLICDNNLMLVILSYRESGPLRKAQHPWWSCSWLDRSLLTQSPPQNSSQSLPSLVYWRCVTPGRMGLGESWQCWAAGPLGLSWAWRRSGFWHSVQAGDFDSFLRVQSCEASPSLVADCCCRGGQAALAEGTWGQR